MKKIIHKSESRGYADHGWLKAKHSFSFANYYDPEKMGFGLLRVLNDDIIEAGQGFGTHPHRDMEIISVPLRGELVHKDNQGHEEVIYPNDIQVMSAGSGILHSEYNYSQTEETNLLQLWILTDRAGHEPRYDQKTFSVEERKDDFVVLVSPKNGGDGLWINQNAYISRLTNDVAKNVTYNLHSDNNGIYVFVIEGEVEATDEKLSKRDAIGIWDTEKVELNAKENSDVLIVEVPMS